MDIIIIVTMIGIFVVPPAVAFYEVGWLVYDVLVKRPRRNRWCEAHAGELIGSDAFFEWCRDHDIEPRYYV